MASVAKTLSQLLLRKPPPRAKHLETFTAQNDGSTNDIWIGIKLVPPERLAKHSDQGATRFVFFASKWAAQHER